MFTSLRSRLWLSYAGIITIALSIVTIVILAFLIRNPLLSRQTQERLRDAQNAILANPTPYLEDPSQLKKIQQGYDVRVLVFDSKRNLVFDSSSGDPGIPFPRRNILNRAAPTARDENGDMWLYTYKKM